MELDLNAESALFAVWIRGKAEKAESPEKSVPVRKRTEAHSSSNLRT